MNKTVIGGVFIVVVAGYGVYKGYKFKASGSGIEFIGPQQLSHEFWLQVMTTLSVLGGAALKSRALYYAYTGKGKEQKPNIQVVVPPPSQQPQPDVKQQAVKN